MRLLRLPAVAAVCALLALLAVGVSDNAAPPSLEVDLQEVRDATLAAGTAHLRLRATITDLEHEELEVSGEGVVDLASPQAHVRLQLPRILGGTSLEVLSGADGLLLRSPVLDADGRWVRTSPPPDTGLGALALEGSASGILDSLAGAAEPAGSDRLHGEKMRRYRIRPPAGGEAVLWIDARGRLRRYRHRRSGPFGTRSVEIDLDRLGHAISLPEPRRVVEMSGRGEPGG